MIKDIKELNFPKYATLETASATIADMGDRTITSQVKIDGDVVPDFSYDWEVEFKGERYIHPVKTPRGTKDNTSRKSKIDLVFQHWAIYEMKRQYFVEMASTSAGTAIADKYIASLGLNLGDFVTAFNLVLNHYFDGRIVIRLNPEWQYDEEAKFVSISYSYIWDVLQQMHEIYGVRWTLKTNADGVCEILMGYPAEEVSHIFEYGFEGGLLSVQRQVQSTEIRNRLLGRGGSKNLPHRYFKDKDPNNPLFEADPDWIPELANITFTELRGKTFRDYVRGWKAKRYGGTPMAEPTEAYLAGYNAEKFDPIEYVDDKESIEKYGVLVGALENNEDIYPSIQGAPGDVDMIVDAEQVTDDDVDAAVENDAVETNVDGMSFTKTGVKTGEEVSINVSARNAKVYFSVPEGKKGTINEPSYTAKGKYGDRGNVQSVPDGLITVYRDKCSLTVHKKSTGEQVSRLNIPPGEYYYEAKVVASHAYTGDINLTASVSAIRLITSTDTDSGWRQTFDIWVRNIWGSERNTGETDQQYADRVWLPILGDRMGDEARVVFASGWLSFSSNWEFPIVGYAFDDSKTDSHWRLTLAKIDAEKDAGRPFIPYEGYNAAAWDRFFFIGIDMPWQYVYWGEERVDDYKRDRLPETARINPSWVIKTDKVRLNQERLNENDEKIRLIDNLKIGSQIRLANKQFISGVYESLYIQSISYNWTTDTILYPDMEVVVSDKVAAVKNPVAQMQGSIETLQRQVGSLSNIQQIIRQVCDQLYLRKDGIEDLSKSPTRFLGKVTGEKFRQGQIGGRDWGIYRDENGNAILEADKIVARQGILVSDLVVNEATYVGGLQINSAASMKITAVEETEAGYICYFDQQQGSVTNKFKVDDVALCQKFDPEYNEVKFYKRRIVATGETSVTLSKADVKGTGVPAIDDEIIHYGNYTDKTRQFVIIRDVIGGGYERMLMELDSVTSDGIEYYFAGKSADSKARWFVGDKDQYAEYKDGQLIIKGNIFVTGSDQSIEEQIAQLDFIREAFGDGMQGLILGTAIIVGYNNDQGDFVPMAGMSGVFDEDSDNGGPAAWYGGTLNTAKIVFNMDGSGYLADKNISWDKDGSVTFSDNIKISAEGDETLGTVLTFINKINSWFEFDEEAKMIKAKYGLYSLGAITAKGKSSSTGSGTGGSGSSTLAGLTDVSITSPTDGQVLMYSGESGKGKWINWNKTYTLWGASDVSDEPAKDGQVLVYDKASEMWVPKTVSASGGGADLTYDNIIAALGFTPFDANAFTKTNIRNALGIKDWALASSKPSYTWIEIGSRPTALSEFTNDLGLGSLAYKSNLMASDIPSLPWSKITSGKPTTLAGYGITDAVKSSEPIYKVLGYIRSGSLNDATDIGVNTYNNGSGALTDFPSGMGYGTILTLAGEGASTYLSQLVINSSGLLAVRTRNSGAWGEWNQMMNYQLNLDPSKSYSHCGYVSTANAGWKTLGPAMAIGVTNSTLRIQAEIRTGYPRIYASILNGGVAQDWARLVTYEGAAEESFNCAVLKIKDVVVLSRNLDDLNTYLNLGGKMGDLIAYANNIRLYTSNGGKESLTVLSDGTTKVTSLKIGDASLTWDSEAGMLKIDKGLYSTGAVTAGGKGSSNKYRLDNWNDWIWAVDPETGVQLDYPTDSRLLESSLSAKLGIELNARLATVETYFDAVTLSSINGQAATVANGVNTVIATTAATLMLKDVTPKDTNKSCVLHIVKAGNYLLSIPLAAASGVTVISSTGTVATSATSIAGYRGVIVTWNPELKQWTINA